MEIADVRLRKVIVSDILDVTLRLPAEFDTIIVDIFGGPDPSGEGLYEECKVLLEDEHPEAVHLFWLFQRDCDTKVAEQFALLQVAMRQRPPSFNSNRVGQGDGSLDILRR